ncbi:MAG TPA: hypothetical protein VIF15_16830 [Polyangiaceae bacterium]|jgi:hypothetical protein
MENRVFFPQALLDQWLGNGAVELDDGILEILGEGRRYRLAEAVRVLREVSGVGDTHDLVGRAKTRAFLEQMGAELVEGSMLLGECAYDVEPGWVGVPVGTFAEHVGSAARKEARADAFGPEPTTDEDLLASFLSKHL